ncbi:purine-nucleoside phosphorylase [Pollutibacter soli]|uniref:purine-nucleoside phosphorylase n=1 Tax=Pollutibacter soli TaxID=3034157 RepID=UPI0030141580
MTIPEQIGAAVDFIKTRYAHQPDVGIVLGSGLGNFSKELFVDISIPYEEIPHFPVATVVGHQGKLIFGSVGGKRVVAMAGRFHYYEGYTPTEVVFPIRVMKALGIETLLVSNAAGGVNPEFKVGELMIITDHISMAIVNPLLGRNIEELGPRFPDMSQPYSRDLIQKAAAIAEEQKIRIKYGVYFGVTGPTFETRAEYKMIKILGADAVGMSTVQEVIAACHMGLKVFAISVITDLGIREEDNTITHQEVLEAAVAAEPLLSSILTRLIAVC